MIVFMQSEMNGILLGAVISDRSLKMVATQIRKSQQGAVKVTKRKQFCRNQSDQLFGDDKWNN